MIETKKIKKYVKNLGGDVAGIADLALLEGIKTKPPHLLDGYIRAISVGKRYDDGIFDMIEETHKPSTAYAVNSRNLNIHLDMIAEHLVDHIKGRGYKAHAIPCSQSAQMAAKITPDMFNGEEDKTFDWGPFTSSDLPNKAVARAAGLGWFGKHMLMINPKLGPCFRLVSVITDMPLNPDRTLDKQKCGKCTLCVDACPTNAIKGISFDGIPPVLDEILELPRCRDLLWKKYAVEPEIRLPICGVCIAVCPWRKKTLKHRIGRALFGWVPADIITSLPKFIWT
ncbi:MAG: epoxyqueuosine reductase [Deltaproteobacteria bacterium]|nr:epoxyqueuosine reductase [Deltaproteobacteria bacterium]